MPATARVALLDGVLVRGWYLDVKISAAWTPVSGIQTFKPTMADTMKDGTTFDGAGWKTETKTASQWGAEGTLLRAPQSGTPGSYDVGAEYLRTQSRNFGAANSVYVRYYEVNGDNGTRVSGGLTLPITEGWEGNCSVTWAEKNDAQDDLRIIEFKLAGRGAPIAMAFNPASS